MEQVEELCKLLIDIPARQNATPEEKKVPALIKSALLSRNLFSFIREVETAPNGLGKVKAETVKGVVEYARVHNEAQIRTLFANDHNVESIVERENNRLTGAEVWVRGVLSYFGLLQD